MHAHVQADTRLTSIRALRRGARCLLESLGVPETIAADIEVALGEALANAHEHAYQGAVGPLEIEFDIEHDEFSCRIRDQGGPVRTPPRVPGQASGGTNRSHQGLYVMGRVMDMIEITLIKNGTPGIEVRMRKFLVYQ